MPVLGPGTLTIGATGTEIDVSCLVNGARITASKDQGDTTTKLCGTQVPGSVTYTASLTGNVDIDPDTGDKGLFALSWADPGSQQPFMFTPNTALGVKAAGTLVIDPLDFGADTYGDDLTSDFEFTIIGDIVYTFPGGVLKTFQTGRAIQPPRIAPPPAPAPATTAPAPAPAA